MIQYFPTSRFKCLTQNQINRLDVNKIEENNPEDCILKVDLESPKELHNKNKHVLNKTKVATISTITKTFTKFHRGLKLKQYHWLKSYINFNTKKEKKIQAMVLKEKHF